MATVRDVGSTPLDQLIEKQSKNISKGSAIILITSSNDQTHEILMEILRRKGFHMLKVILENASFMQDYEKPVGPKIDPTGSEIIVSYGDDIGKVLSIS